MKKFVVFLFSCWALMCPLLSVAQNANYKHPALNVSQTPALHLTVLHWISKEEIISNASGEQIAFVQGETIIDSSGKRIGKMAKNTTYYEANGAAEFNNQSALLSPCKKVDSRGNVVRMIPQSYKNQTSMHCRQ